MADFPQAMRWLLDGRSIRRRDLNRPFRVADGTFGELCVFTMFMRDGSFGSYTPSHCDMRADDWVMVDHYSAEKETTDG